MQYRTYQFAAPNDYYENLVPENFRCDQKKDAKLAARILISGRSLLEVLHQEDVRVRSGTSKRKVASVR